MLCITKHTQTHTHPQTHIQTDCYSAYNYTLFVIGHVSGYVLKELTVSVVTS